MAPQLTPRRVLIARVLALAVDLVQWVLLPVELTPLNNVIDAATGLALIALVGWHWAFLPTFLAEMVPFVDLVPTWTLAVLFATRGDQPKGAAGGPQPPGALPPPPPSLPPSRQERGVSGS
jgi:hypothetical protein